MRRIQETGSGRAARLAAAVAVTFALLAGVDRGFGPLPAAPARGEASAPVEVAIQPSRIEVVAVRPRDFAQEAELAATARAPRS